MSINVKRPDGTNRVVITGMGAISPAGVGVKALWDAVMGKQCCIAPVERFDTTDQDVHLAGEVRGFDATEHGMTKKEARRFERFVQYAVVASDEAMAQRAISEWRKTRRALRCCSVRASAVSKSSRRASRPCSKRARSA